MICCTRWKKVLPMTPCGGGGGGECECEALVQMLCAEQRSVYA